MILFTQKNLEKREIFLGSCSSLDYMFCKNTLNVLKKQ